MSILAGRTALVTGGAGGIGAAIALRFAREGARVAVVDFDKSGLERLSSVFESSGLALTVGTCDVTKTSDIVRSVGEIQNDVGNIDILVNNAGGSGPRPILDIEKIDEEVWDHVINLNLKSAFTFSKLLIPAMRAQRFGRVINMSSTLRDGLSGPLNTVNARLPYSTAKSALVGFTRQLAKDVAAYGITVNALAPGLIQAGAEARIAQKFASLDETARKQMTSAIPIGRGGDGDDVANGALFFASPASSYVTGDLMAIAGGL